MDPASRYFYDEKQVISNEAAFRPYLDRREINRAQAIPMSFQKYTPGCLLPSVRSRFNAMGFQNGRDGAFRDRASHIF